MFKIGQLVKLHTCDEWNCLLGIIDQIEDEYVAIFCITMPCNRYYVKLEDAANVLEMINFDVK